MSNPVLVPESPKKNAAMPLALAAVVVVGIGAYWMGRQTAPPTEATPVSAAEAPAPDAAKQGTVKFTPESLKLANIEMGTVRTMPLRSTLPLIGQIEANPANAVNVTPRVEGKVIKLFANVGDTVRAGQTLAIIESEKLHEAQLAHRLAMKRVELARQTLTRRRKLAALGEYGKPGVEGTRTRLAELDGEVQKAYNDIATAQSVIAQAEAEVRAKQAAVTQSLTQQNAVNARAVRADALYKEELMSRQDLEQAHAERDKARADVDAARAQVTQAEASVTAAMSHQKSLRASLSAMTKQRDFAIQTLKRAETVYAGGFNTSKEVAEAESAYAQAKIEAEGALDDVELLGGRPGDLHEIPVKAAMDGRVTERKVTLGQTVAAGTTLLTLLDSGTVWAQMNAPQSELSQVRVGLSVTLRSEAAPNQTFTAVVSSIGETADETTRTVKVRCIVKNASDKLRPGVFVTGTLTGESKGTTLAVPQDTVQQFEGKTVVFVPTGTENEFRAQEVTTGATIGGMAAIESGVKVGDKVVIKNAFLVKSQAMKSELGEE